MKTIYYLINLDASIVLPIQADIFVFFYVYQKP